MKNTALLVAVFSLPLVLAAFAVGWTLSGVAADGSRAAPPRPERAASTTSAENPLRTAVRGDVPGRDVAGLPRPPGSTRVGYQEERQSGFAKARAEYLTDADPDEVRAFYRRAFAAGEWVVADLGFSPEEWYFFVVKDEREVLVEIHALRQPVVVEVELTGPGESSAGNAPAPPAVRSVPAPQPEGDDEEESDDGYYEGGDD